MNNGPILNCDGYDSCNSPKNFHVIKPLGEFKKNCVSAELVNEVNDEKMTKTYDGYGSYDFPKYFLSMKPLKEIEKQVSREFDNEKNKH